MKRLLIATLILVVAESAATIVRAQDYDIAILGGRVMDAEIGLDAVRHAGIRGGRIAIITAEAIEAHRTIDASELVVSPGFIDLHAHGQAPFSRRLQAPDGATTALELEIGVFPVGDWYDSHNGKSIINYGATVSHLGARISVFHDVDVGHLSTAPPEVLAAIASRAYSNELATQEQITLIADLLREGLREGALGLGFGVGYAPKSTHNEIYQTFKVAQEFSVPVFVHMRSRRAFNEADSIGSTQEVIATGAALHIVHLGSSGGGQTRVCLEMIRGARQQGIDVTTEVYPWTASSTRIESALYDTMPDGNDYS